MYLVLFLCHFDCKSSIFFGHMQVFLYFCSQINRKMDIFEYIEQHSSAESDVLKQITRSTHLEVINPRMLSGHVQGRVLSMLSQMIQPKRILELGTFTGYSALCLAEGLTEDGELVTLEHNDEMEDAIRRNLGLSPLGEKVKLVIGDAKESLQRLKGEFDLVFIDADKKEYCDYLDLVLPLMRKGGWILADNTLWDGHIVDPAYDKDKQTIALREFNDKVAQDARLEKVILPLRDGLTIIRVVSE
jgi:predicted O-methyltransferase YrrM